MIALVFSFVAGILIFQQFESLPDSHWIFLLVILGIISLLKKWWRISCLLFGIGWTFCIAFAHLSKQLPENLAGKDIQIQGQVIDLPQMDERKVRFNFLLQGQKKGVPDKIRLSWYYPKTSLKVGQVWQFTVRLKPPHGNLNPGGFDYEKWLFVKNIGATGYVRNKPEPVLITERTGWKGIDIWREIIARRLENYSDTILFFGLIKALIIGDKSSISQSQWQVLRKTGTVHLMAISGLHIGMIAGIVFFLVIKVWLRTGILRWLPAKSAALAAIIVAVLYSSLAGFSVPTQRALIMLSMAMLAIFAGKQTRSYHTLAVAILFVLVYDPLAILNAGFWLSFAAVAMIIFVLGGRLRRPGYWKSAASIHFVTATGLAPLLFLFFQQTSLVAPIANLIAVPVVGLIIVPLSLLAGIGLFFGLTWLQGLLSLIDNFFHLLWNTLVFFSDLPIAVVNRPQPDLFVVGLAITGILWFVAPKGIPARWLGGCLVLPLVFPVTDQLKPGEAKLTLLDVGQGLSVVIQTANHTLVFDTGAKYSQRYDSGSNVLIPFLRFHHINKVDTLIVSHGDNDHIGGAYSLMEGMQVKKVISSVPDKLIDYDPVTCIAGQQWFWDGIEFLILSPGENFFDSENDNSCVLLVTTETGKFLLTGDIEKPAENWLVATYGKKLQAEVLIAPHHGSKSSSSFAFLEQVKPKIVLFPVGYLNRFGFPHQEIEERYRLRGVQLFKVAKTGAISVKLGRRLTKIETWRDKHGKYWNK
jgi:competence protein ComEC